MRLIKSLILSGFLLASSVSAFAAGAPLCPTPREISYVKLMTVSKYNGRKYAESVIAYIFSDGRFWFVKVGPLDEAPGVQQNALEQIDTPSGNATESASTHDDALLAHGNSLMPHVGMPLGFRSNLDEHQWRCQYTISAHQLKWIFAYSPVTNRDLPQ